MGRVYRDTRRYPEALDCFTRALSLRRAAGDRAGEGRTLYDIGITHQAAGDRRKAVEYYEDALPLATAAGSASEQEAVLVSLGMVYAQLERAEEAVTCYRKAIALQEADECVGGGRSIYFAGPDHMTLEIATSSAPVDADHWIDPAVLAKAGISAEEAARFRAPAPYDGPSPVAQPAYDAAMPHMVFPHDTYRKMLAMPDDVVTRTSSYAAPPVP